MSFFKDLVGLAQSVQWSLSIHVDENQMINLLISPLSDDQKGKKTVHIPPLHFTGTPEDFDHHLIEELRKPVAETATFFRNKHEHEAALEAVRKKAIEDKKTTPQPKQPEANPKTKQFEAAMKKVKDLEGAGKVGQAIAQMPKASDYPGFEAQISAKAKELRQKHVGFSLFEQDEPVTPTPTPTPTSEHEPEESTDEEDQEPAFAEESDDPEEQ